MRDALVRGLVAFPVAVLLPTAFPALEGRVVRAVVVAALLLGALAPHYDRWETWVAIAVATAAAAVPARPAEQWRLSVAMAAVALAGAVVLFDPAATWDGVQAAGTSRDLAIVVAGALAAVFVGGAVIGKLLHPFAASARPNGSVVGMESAGRYIGWLERAILFGLLLAGAPDAAALVVAGKSIARFPSFAREEFAEYYLIGSLLSVLVAGAAAVAVRALIGLSPLPGV